VLLHVYKKPKIEYIIYYIGMEEHSSLLPEVNTEDVREKFIQKLDSGSFSI